jgi:hypothetical protein
MLVDVITRRETINTDTYIRTLKELGQCFKWVQPHESVRNLASAWQCKATHKFEEPASHQKIWLDSVIPSTLQTQSSTLIFPPIWRSEGWCYLQCKVWN